MMHIYKLYYEFKSFFKKNLTHKSSDDMRSDRTHDPVFIGLRHRLTTACVGFSSSSSIIILRFSFWRLKKVKNIVY